MIFWGNIVGLVDINGNSIIKYTYDSYGNVLNITVPLRDILGKDNPYLYKGYYYDFETGLYLLTTRYYNPEWGRFLNADDVSYLNTQSINGLNLYAYCGNNPIMRIDPFGTSWLSSVGNWFVGAGKSIGNFVENNWDIIVGVGATVGLAAFSIATLGIGTVIVGVVVGAAIGAGFGTINALANGDNVLYGMVSGMVVGALGGLGGGGIGGMLLAGASAGVGAATMSLIGDRVNGRQRDFAKAGVSALTAGVFSFLGNGAGNFMASAGKELAVQIVGNSLGSFIFGSYTFVSDLIYDRFRRQ